MHKGLSNKLIDTCSTKKVKHTLPTLRDRDTSRDQIEHKLYKMQFPQLQQPDPRCDRQGSLLSQSIHGVPALHGKLQLLLKSVTHREKKDTKNLVM